MAEFIVTVTKKGQATIPKALRKKHNIQKKALAVDMKDGVLLKPIPDPIAEEGSLKSFFGGRTSGQLVKESRSLEKKREKKRRIG